MTDVWWWCDGPGRRPQRDPREDDPEYYRDRSGQWVKRTSWSVENYETLRDWDTYCRYVQETTSVERERLKAEYMAAQGLVCWESCWVTPERAEELEAQYQEGMKRDRANRAKRREGTRTDRLWHWC